ncbi:MAG: nucleotidyltransferase family protein [Clostridia bacterium]|nr:nucleotidyltransferase family protein [Clostridia bacterium]
MPITGFVGELNPLHNGHKLLIDTLKKNGDTVVCALSSNFVQRGETAILSKSKRTESALCCGVDLVVEIPVPWSMSTAQNFALGGVSQLAAMGCDTLAFGSECGDIASLREASKLEEHPQFARLLSEKLKTGITFAAAREQVATELGYASEVFAMPNDALAVEYLCAARKIGWTPNLFALKRQGVGHDQTTTQNNMASASLLRQILKEGKIGYAERFLPPFMQGFISPEIISDFSLLETAVLAVLRRQSSVDFLRLPDLSEGLENKLAFSVQAAKDLDELYRLIKSKRYPLARVRRLVLSSFLGIDNSFFGKRPPYVRVLGFNKKGETHLKTCVSPNIPVVTRVSQIKELDDFSKSVFATECRSTDLFALTFKPALPCGGEYKNKLLKTEEFT